MSKGSKGGGAGVGGGATATGGTQNAAQRAYPHMAHLLNNAEVVDTARTKTEARDKARGLRQTSEQSDASYFRDPKGKGREKYIIVQTKR